MSYERKIVSRHFLRRRARAVERKLERERLAGVSSGWARFSYRVEKAKKGPHRWYVVRVDRGF